MTDEMLRKLVLHATSPVHATSLAMLEEMVDPLWFDNKKDVLYYCKKGSNIISKLSFYNRSYCSQIGKDILDRANEIYKDVKMVQRGSQWVYRIDLEDFARATHWTNRLIYSMRMVINIAFLLCEGKTIDDVWAAIDRAMKNAVECWSKPTFNETPAIWVNSKTENIYHRFEGMLLGISWKDLDIYGDGFSIPFSLRSTDYNRQREFVRKYRKDLLRHLCDEIRTNKYVLRRIGSLDFYKPTNMVLRRDSLLTVYFDVKKTIKEDDANGS